MTADRMSVNQQIQVGVETTIGTAVACSKLLKCFTWGDQIEADVTAYRGTGHKIDGEQIENAEWMSHDLAGPLDFNGMIYPLSGCLGAATTALISPSTTAYGWTFAPPYIGAAAPKTFTMQQGDATYAHQDAGVLFADWGYKVTRKTDIELNGCKAFGKGISTGITLTASPTAIALAPATGKMVKIYIDTTSAGLGTTQFLKPLSFDFQQTGIYKDVWFMAGATSWDGYADMAPKSGGTLMVEADTAGMALLGYLQSGVTYYMRFDAIGGVIDGANSINNEFKHDMAVKFGKPTKFEDNQGIFAISWAYTLVEDTTWGHYQQVYIANLSAAL